VNKVVDSFILCFLSLPVMVTDKHLNLFPFA
jgi:hypothetical protein